MTTHEGKKKIIKAIFIFTTTIRDKFLLTIEGFYTDLVECKTYFKQKYCEDLLEQKVRLEHQLQNINMMEETTIEVYPEQIENITSKLTNMSVELESIKLMHIILQGLSNNWRPFISQFGIDLTKNPMHSNSIFIKCMQIKEF